MTAKKKELFESVIRGVKFLHSFYFGFEFVGQCSTRYDSFTCDLEKTWETLMAMPLLAFCELKLTNAEEIYERRALCHVIVNAFVMVIQEAAETIEKFILQTVQDQNFLHSVILPLQKHLDNDKLWKVEEILSISSFSKNIIAGHIHEQDNDSFGGDFDTAFIESLFEWNDQYSSWV